MSVRFFQRGKKQIWWVRGPVQGPGKKVAHVYESLKYPDWGLAEQIWAARQSELFAELVYGKRPSVSFAACATGYLEFEFRSDQTAARVQRLIAHFGERRSMDSIDQTAADDAVRATCRRGVKSSTKVRQVYGPLTTIFEFCSRPARAWCDPRRFEKPAVQKTPTHWFTPVLALRLEECAAPHLKPMLRFLLCTGARLSEAINLTWADVDLAAGHAMFRNTKGEKLSETVKPRKAALPPAAIIALANLDHRQGHVFLRDDGKPYEERERDQGGQIKSAWATACRKAGLPGRWRTYVRHQAVRWRTKAGEIRFRKVRKPQRIWQPEYTPHDCRHSFATWFYALSKDLILLAAEGGWSGTKIVERYAHLMPSDLVADISLVWGVSHPRLGALPSRANPVQTANPVPKMA